MIKETFINRFINFYIMELKFLKSEKDELQFEIDNVTLAEILRVYLAKDSSVDFVAWRREHLTEKPIFKVKGKNVKPLIKSAITDITKDLDSAYNDFKAL